MTLPTSWSGVTITQYHKLITIFNLFKEDAVERNIHLLALFTNQGIKEIEKMKVTDLINEAKKLSFLENLPTDERLSVTFKLKDKEYKAILINAEMDAGQFIDFSHAGKECSSEELPYHMHELIACMCKQKTDNGWEYKAYTETSEDFLEMPMSIAYPYYVFFCKVLINLQKPIQEYSLKNLKKMAKQEKKELEKILMS